MHISGRFYIALWQLGRAGGGVMQMGNYVRRAQVKIHRACVNALSLKSNTGAFDVCQYATP